MEADSRGKWRDGPRKRRACRHLVTRGLGAIWLSLAAHAWAEEKAHMMMEPIPQAQWQFGGELGVRIDANVSNWLLRAPAANPGMIDMFRRRDRHLPYATPVPWAGEFAGKYLISAVQACRMSADPDLRQHTQSFVDELISCQAENGYLGPWPVSEQLLGHWDLWGHYHCMLGLLMWADDSGDREAYECVLRAAECICRVYVDGTRRPIESGSPSMNLSIMHIAAELYRRTENPRILALLRRLEEDLQQDGDWLRLGSGGVPYFQLPGSGPRWESLHIVQSFAILYQVTGEPRYLDAVISLWRSIRDVDRHPSGAFSSNEGATGTIYTHGAIETCCSVAWMALSIDALRLTGDPLVADELELTLWNQALGQQHPSGNWCTYDTPMNGVRAPSYHQINFQYRPGTPELNCCSVNGPRTLGMCSEWAVMRRANGITVNFYGPGEFDIPYGDQQRIRIVQDTRYPVEGAIRMTLSPTAPLPFALQLRIPAWSRQTTLKLNGAPLREVPQPGTYLTIERTWQAGDTLDFQLDMTPRLQVGRGPDRGGCGAIHAGPLLLAFDTQFNPIEIGALPPMNAADLALTALPVPAGSEISHPAPMGLWQARTASGTTVVLCDFGSAGATGTEYASWLPVSHLPPTDPMLLNPNADATGKPGSITFRWATSGAPDETYTLLVARDAACQDIVLQRTDIETSYVTLKEGLSVPGRYYWRVVAANAFGETPSVGDGRPLNVDPGAPGPFPSRGDDGALLIAPLAGTGEASLGLLDAAAGITAAANHQDTPDAAVRFDGTNCGLRYSLPFFPETDYAFCAWICPQKPAADTGIQQIFSAWCRVMDDPLRVTLDQGKLSARIEAGGAWQTAEVPIENGTWVHVAAVKQGTALTLYINGKPGQSTGVPEKLRTRCTMVGVGFNPLYSGGEYYTGCIADVRFYDRALTPAEIEHIAGD